MERKEDRFDTVVRKINELSGIYRNAAAKSGISVNEFWVWYTLVGDRREFTQQEICAYCGLPKQTVNTIVRNMVRRKFATLEIIPLNRSRKRIRDTGGPQLRRRTDGSGHDRGAPRIPFPPGGGAEICPSFPGRLSAVAAQLYGGLIWNVS